MKLGKLKAGLAGTALCALATLSAVPAAAQQGGISNGYLEGKWKDNLLCLGKPQFVFDANGSVMIADTALADYAVSGPNQVTLSGAGGQYALAARPIDADTMYVSDNQGLAGEMHRCSPTPQAAKNMAYAPQVAPQIGGITPAYLLGRWTDTNNCAVTNTFYPNGTLVGNAGQAANWSLAGNQLTVFANGGAAVMSLWMIDQNTMRTVDASGQQGISRRCP